MLLAWLNIRNVNQKSPELKLIVLWRYAVKGKLGEEAPPGHFSESLRKAKCKAEKNQAVAPVSLTLASGKKRTSIQSKYTQFKTHFLCSKMTFADLRISLA